MTTIFKHAALGLGIVGLIVGATPAIAQDVALAPQPLPIERQALVDALPATSWIALPGPSVSIREAGRVRSDKPSAVDAKFTVLGIGLVTAMAADTHSTYQANAWCRSCSEGDPYAAPFINRGPAVAYAAGAVFDLGVMKLAGVMRRSDNPAVRSIWWAVPVALIVGHTLAIRHNLSLRAECQGNPACGGPR